MVSSNLRLLGGGSSEKMVLPYNAQVHSMFGTTEKNRSGPQRRKFPPLPAQIYASAQTIFLSRQSQGLDLSGQPMHYPDEAKIIYFPLDT